MHMLMYQPIRPFSIRPDWTALPQHTGGVQPASDAPCDSRLSPLGSVASFQGAALLSQATPRRLHPAQLRLSSWLVSSRLRSRRVRPLRREPATSRSRRWCRGPAIAARRRARLCYPQCSRTRLPRLLRRPRRRSGVARGGRRRVRRRCGHAAGCGTFR